MSYLDNYVASKNNTEMTIEIQDIPGAGVRACTSAAYQHAFDHPYDISLIMAGAQDFVRFDNYIDRYIFPYNTRDFFTGYMTGLFQEGELAIKRIRKESSPLLLSLAWTSTDIPGQTTLRFITSKS